MPLPPLAVGRGQGWGAVPLARCVQSQSPKTIEPPAGGTAPHPSPSPHVVGEGEVGAHGSSRQDESHPHIFAAYFCGSSMGERAFYL